MRHEIEFKTYLTTEKRSVRTNQPFSAKVASDTLSRCKVVERMLGIDLADRTHGSDQAIQRLCELIKRRRLSSTEARPYAHNELILAVRTYREFLTSRSS